MKFSLQHYGPALLAFAHLRVVICSPVEHLLPHRSVNIPIIDAVDVKDPQAVQEACDRITQETWEAFFSNQTLLGAAFEEGDSDIFVRILEGLLSNELSSISLPSGIIDEDDTKSNMSPNSTGPLAAPGDPFQIEHKGLKGVFKDFSQPVLSRADVRRLGWCGFIAISLDMHNAQKTKSDEYLAPTWTYSGGKPPLRLKLVKRNIFWEYGHLLWVTKWLQDFASEWKPYDVVPSCTVEMYITSAWPMVRDYLLASGSLELHTEEVATEQQGILISWRISRRWRHNWFPLVRLSDKMW